MGKGIGEGVPACMGFPFLGVHTLSLHAGLTASKTALQAGVIRLLRSNRVVLLSVASYCSILCKDVIRLLRSNRELLLSGCVRCNVRRSHFRRFNPDHVVDVRLSLYLLIYDIGYSILGRVLLFMIFGTAKSTQSSLRNF